MSCITEKRKRERQLTFSLKSTSSLVEVLTPLVSSIPQAMIRNSLRLWKSLKSTSSLVEVLTPLMSSIPQSRIRNSLRLWKILNIEEDKTRLLLKFLSSLHIICLNWGSFSTFRIFNFGRIPKSISSNFGRLFRTISSKLGKSETYVKKHNIIHDIINCKIVINIKILGQYWKIYYFTSFWRIVLSLLNYIHQLENYDRIFWGNSSKSRIKNRLNIENLLCQHNTLIFFYYFFVLKITEKRDDQNKVKVRGQVQCQQSSRKWK